MKTNEVMKELNIGRKALLLYEKRGFIHPKRDISDYRIYSDNDMKELKKIVFLRKMDFSLDEIEKILNKEVFDLSYKRNEYNQKIHELELKKQLIGKTSISLELDENIDNLFSDLKGSFEEEKEVIPFSIQTDGFFFLWFFCLLIALYAHNINLIIMTFLLGVSLYMISLRKKKSTFQWLTPIAIIMLMVCGVIGIYIQWRIDSVLMRGFIVGYSFVLIIYSLFLIDRVKNFLLAHSRVTSIIFMALGSSIIFGLLFIDFFLFDFFSSQFWKNYGYMINILGSCFWLIGISLKRYEI